jgi:hypothetical protein
MIPIRRNLRTKKNLLTLIRLQDRLISKLKYYYVKKDDGEDRWIEEWYDAMTVAIQAVKDKLNIKE